MSDGLIICHVNGRDVTVKYLRMLLLDEAAI